MNQVLYQMYHQNILLIKLENFNIIFNKISNIYFMKLSNLLSAENC